MVSQKVESKSGSKLLVHEKKSPLEREKVKTVDAKDLSFWILLESSLNDILTPAETSAFISKMKNVSAQRQIFYFKAVINLI